MNTITVNGVRIAFERRGRGPTMILVHGFPLDHTIWDEVAGLLETSFDLILPDLRGFGESDAPADGTSMSHYAGDLTAILNHLRIEQAIIAGHSMGGYAALMFARMFPQRLRGLGLIATQHLADAPDRKAGRYATAETVLQQGAVVVADGMAPKLTANPDQVPALRELILRQRPTGIAGALHAMAERPDSSDLLPRLKLPALVIAGLADALIPPERSREMAAALKSARLIELEGIGHSPMLEAPRQVADGLKNLL